MAIGTSVVTLRGKNGSKAYHLFLDIVAVVARSPDGLTVREIGRVLDLQPELVAHCIALHFYLEMRPREPIPIPTPADYRVPGLDERIDRVRLESWASDLAGRDGEEPRGGNGRPQH
jgi:hypothetical protein